MNTKNKNWVRFKIVLIMFLMYMHFMGQNSFYFKDIHYTLEEVFGKFKSFFIVYLILTLLRELIKTEEKKIVFTIRLNFFFLLLIFLNNLELLNYSQHLGSTNIEKDIFSYLYIDKNIGMLLTMIFFNFYFKLPINLNIALTGTMIFFSLFIIFGKIIGNGIRKIVYYCNKENREKRKKRKTLVKEDKKIKREIAIKERKERKENEKILKKEVEKENNIKKKISELKKQKGFELKKEKALNSDKISIKDSQDKEDKIRERQMSLNEFKEFYADTKKEKKENSMEDEITIMLKEGAWSLQGEEREISYYENIDEIEIKEKEEVAENQLYFNFIKKVGGEDDISL